MNCKQAQRLIGPHILGDLEPKSFECLALEAHLQSCPACREEYAGFKQTIEFIQDNRAEFAQALKNLEKQETAQACAPGNAKKSQIIRLVIRVAAAACILIGISVWLMLSYTKAPAEPAGQFLASNQAPSIKIERISDNSAVIIPAGRNIFTPDGQLMTLRINEKHRLIINENTSLSINSLAVDENIGCSVQLLRGEIYTHVEHDGNPFVVKTPNGDAVITGTTFDIQATEIETKLIVAEGTVRFESSVSSVEVSKGQFSRILNNSAPTIPSLCDAAELTAWVPKAQATDYELKSALAKIESVTDSFDLTDLWLTASSGEIDLGNLDYQEWIEQKRNWFEREFTPIFGLKDALAKADIEADYQELLFATGDIWQFAYPQVSNQQIPVITLDSLLKACSRYGFNEQWILDNIPSAKSLPDNPKQILTGENAFTKWGELFENLRGTNKSPDSDMLLYSLHAATYLTNTRTLAWLYISNEKTDISAEDKEQVLDLLQSQVNTANELTNLVIRLFAASEKQSCKELDLLIDQVADNLALLTDIEERVLEYEIGK